MREDTHSDIVLGTSLAAFISAPRSSSSCTTSLWPPSHAQCKGVFLYCNTEASCDSWRIRVQCQQVVWCGSRANTTIHGCIYHSHDGERLHHNNYHAHVLEEMRIVTLCWAPGRPRSYPPRARAAVAPPPGGLESMLCAREFAHPAIQKHHATVGG